MLGRWEHDIATLSRPTKQTLPPSWDFAKPLTYGGGKFAFHTYARRRIGGEILDFMRQKKRLQGHGGHSCRDVYEEEIADPQTISEHEHVGSDFADMLLEILSEVQYRGVPMKSVKYFRMYYIEFMTMEEVAKECGVDRKAVSLGLVRARKILADYGEARLYQSCLTKGTKDELTPLIHLFVDVSNST